MARESHRTALYCAVEADGPKHHEFAKQRDDATAKLTDAALAEANYRLRAWTAARPLEV